MKILQRGIRWGMSLSKFDPKVDYYKALNLSSSASADQIKKAFKDMAKKYHPDVAKGNEDKFKEVNEAYQILSSAETKKEYDESRAEPVRKTTSSTKPRYSHQQYEQYPQEEEEQPRYQREFTQQEFREHIRKQHQQQMRHYSQQRRNYDDLGKTYQNYDRFAEELMRKKASQFQADRVTMESVKHQEELRQKAYEVRRQEQRLRRQQELKKEVRQRYNKARQNSEQVVQGFKKMGNFVKDMFSKK